MFKAKIKGTILKEMVNVLTAMVDESKLNLTADGISVRAVDPANVAMVAMNLKKEAFESFDATEGVIGIDLTKLSSFTDDATNEDEVTLELDEVAHKLKIMVRGLTYTMLLLDPNNIRKEPKMPELDLPVNILISGSDFKYGMKACEKVGDYVYFSMNKEKSEFSILAVGDTDDVVLRIPMDAAKITKTSNAKSMFASDYLTKIQKLAEKTEELKVVMGTDYPMKLSFPIAEGNGIVEYMIAPRVEAEEEKQ